MERPLTPTERRRVHDALRSADIAPPAVCEEALDTAVLIRRTPAMSEIRGARSAIAYAALKTRASGITLGRRVFIRHEFYGDDGHVPCALVAHELAHVVQYLRDGTTPFLARYVRDYLIGLASGLDDRRAYLNIPYEVEARRVAELLEG